MKNIVGEETGEILSYEEMREFDGNVEEPPDLTATEETPIQNAEHVRTSEEEKDFAKDFDSEADCQLYDLLGDCFILVLDDCPNTTEKRNFQLEPRNARHVTRTTALL